MREIRKRKPRLIKSQRDNVRDQYFAGVDPLDISKNFGISVANVRAIALRIHLCDRLPEQESDNDQ